MGTTTATTLSRADHHAVVGAAVAAGACADCARLVLALVVAVATAEVQAGDDSSGLTGRERDVLGLLALGLTAAQIGRRLGISGATVRKHLEHVYAKLGVHDRLSATTHARRHGVLRDDAS